MGVYLTMSNLKVEDITGIDTGGVRMMPSVRQGRRRPPSLPEAWTIDIECEYLLIARHHIFNRTSKYLLKLP